MTFEIASRMLLLALETVLIVFLIRGRVWRRYPIFFVYGLWLLIGDAGMDLTSRLTAQS